MKLLKLGDVTKFVASLAENVRKKLSWSRDASDSVKVGRARDTNRGVEAELFVGKKDTVGKFLAFEYGSGIHATRGRRHTYKIFPRKGLALAFHWQKGEQNIGKLYGSLYRAKQEERIDKFLGRAPDGRLMFYYVDHPGVEPRHDIAEAIAETLNGEEMDMLSNAIRTNTIDYLNSIIKEANQ